MKAFITGIGGFVGRYLAPSLRSAGFEVSGIDRQGTPIDDCEIFTCDILDQENLRSLLLRIRPDVIFHLAALSSVRDSFNNAEQTKQVNVLGTKTLFDALISCSMSPTILVTSSLQVYGTPDKLPITESDPLRPASPYAESKVEQERLCAKYSRKGLRIIISRSFNHTGPGQSTEFVWPSFAKQIVEVEQGKRKEIQVGNLEVERDFCDVRDIVQAYVLAVRRCVPGETYNICSGRAYHLGRMLDIMKSFARCPIRVVPDPALIRKKDVPVLYGDNSKFVKATGWQPRIPFEQTLKDILEYWRTQPGAQS